MANLAISTLALSISHVHYILHADALTISTLTNERCTGFSKTKYPLG